HPAPDERFGAHASPEQVLPYGERAGDAEQCFRCDESDGGEVQVAKPGIAHPPPAERGAEPDQQQSADDERGDREMDDEQDVSDHGRMIPTNTRFPRLTPEQMSPVQREVAAEISAGPRGEVRGPFIAWL